MIACILARVVWALAFVVCLAGNAYPQVQVYDTLQTSTFRIVLNRYTIGGFGYATGIRECRYRDVTFRDTIFTMGEAETFTARTDSPPWAYPHPTRVSVQRISDTVKQWSIPFYIRRDPPDTNTIIGSITMRVTSHRYFLEFELTDVTGDCGEINLLRLTFLGLSPGIWPGWDSLGQNHYEYNQITYLGNGYYACFVAANANSNPARIWDIPTSVFVRVLSPRYIPAPPGNSSRNQRFAFFLCREEDLRNRVREVETYFNYPYGVSLKENPENNIDYLFLLGDSIDVSAQQIISLCRSTGLGAVLLYQGFWSAWTDSTEPFKLWDMTTYRTRPLVDSLKAAGLIVGLHAYVHLVPKDGYFYKRHRGSVSTCVIDGTFRTMNWETSLPDSVVHHFVAKVQVLRPDWLYFDGNEGPFDFNSCSTKSYDIYLAARQTWKILQELRQRNYGHLKIFQDAGGTNAYHFKSRIGQTDYWAGAPWTRNPVPQMQFTASQVVHRRRGLYTYTDLGWFGRRIHLYCPPNYCSREATRSEWDTLASISERANIPVGIRTTYNDFMFDTLHSYIVPLLRQTIQRRRGTTEVPHGESSPTHYVLEQNYPNPFNPTTTIGYQVSSTSHVTLKIYDILGREVATLVNEKLQPGKYSVRWDASGTASGVYFCRMQAGGFAATKKLVVIR